MSARAPTANKLHDAGIRLSLSPARGVLLVACESPIDSIFVSRRRHDCLQTVALDRRRKIRIRVAGAVGEEIARPLPAAMRQPFLNPDRVLSFSPGLRGTGYPG